jgi:GntR family transcriptional regulator
VVAREQEAHLLGVPVGDPLMLIERVAYSRSGLPLEYARDLFRGDRTRITVWSAGAGVVRPAPAGRAARPLRAGAG